jgi:hypothetical protein
MRTEEYKGWKPWVCPGCSAELQFSEADGSNRQLCFIGIALLSLYLLGLRSWQLAVGGVLAGFALALMLGAPLDRIFPRRLEPFAPPPWKKNKEDDKEKDRFVEGKFVTLFPREDSNVDKPKQADQSGDRPPTDL